jgi:alanine racemase
VASVSASALDRNARLAASLLPSGIPAVADVRADAWGHGAQAVIAALTAAGIDRFRIDEAPRAAARALVPDPHLTDDEPTLDPLTVYGLPGGAPDAVPVMRLCGTVLSVKALRAGEGVSYGYAYRAASDTRVALVTGGYAQGIVRALGNRADVGIRGTRHPIVGRVAMDVCVVEIGDAEVSRGDVAVYFGDPAWGDPPLAAWTGPTGMTAAELVTIVGLRATREHSA